MLGPPLVIIVLVVVAVVRVGWEKQFARRYRGRDYDDDESKVYDRRRRKKYTARSVFIEVYARPRALRIVAALLLQRRL